MPYTVLAALLKKRPSEAAPSGKVIKNKVEKPLDNNVEKASSTPGKVESYIKKPCFKFATDEGCSYGDNCRFDHTA
jgi:hypothetical protein